MGRRIICIFMLALPLALPCQKPVERSRILAAGEDWMQEYRMYIADPFFLDSLDKRLKEPIRVDVYFAFWCPDSRRELPRFLKIVDQLREKSGCEIRFFEVERKKSKEQKYYVEDLKVERIPTFIYYRQGNEIGRIVEAPKISLVEDLLSIIF